jgi:hypothetical protein
MILPAWATTHVVGYGVAALLVGGTGTLWLHEHDNRVKAEMHAQDLAIAHQHEDSIVTAQNLAAVSAASAKVETVTVALRSVIQPTRVLIDSARKVIHDTTYVRVALDSASSAIKACQLVASACDTFRRLATDSLASLAALLKQRDHEMLVAVTPPQPRFSRGLQLGAGVCGVGRKVDGKESVFGAPCVSLSYGLQVRF